MMGLPAHASTEPIGSLVGQRYHHTKAHTQVYKKNTRQFITLCSTISQICELNCKIKKTIEPAICK